LRQQLRERIEQLGSELTDEEYWEIRNSLIDEGKIEQGRGYGGSVRRIAESSLQTNQSMPDKAERRLYTPFAEAIKNGYAPEDRAKV
jgi:hypothetical protein